MRTKAYGEELTAETLENERLGWDRWWLKRKYPYGD